MPSIPYASLGFVGFVELSGASRATSVGSFDFGVRATSCDLKLSQAIEKPEVVTGKFDRTVYKLGPKEVGGAVAFPAVLETIGGGTSQVMDALWAMAVYRGPEGRLDSFNAEVRYAAQDAQFIFNSCMVNSFKWSVTQGDLVNTEVDVIGISRTISTKASGYSPHYDTRNTRAATWADTAFDINFGTGHLDGKYIRSFEATVNNNVERFYTCNGFLSPQDVAPKMREITGTMNIMGRHAPLSEYAGGTGLLGGNQDRCNEDSYLRFGYEVRGTSCDAVWFRKFCGVVYEIETLSLSNDIVESAVNWHALPGGATGELFLGDASCTWV